MPKISIGSSKESQVIWRREKVLRLDSLGYTQADIAKELQITQPTVSKDIAYITKQSREHIQHHIEDVLPYERQKALALFKDLKRRAIEIADKKEGEIGHRDRIAALALVKDVEKEIIALQTQGQYVKRALKVAGGLQEKLDSLEEQEEEQQQEQQEEELQLYNDHE